MLAYAYDSESNLQPSSNVVSFALDRYFMHDLVNIMLRYECPHGGHAIPVNFTSVTR